MRHYLVARVLYTSLFRNTFTLSLVTAPLSSLAWQPLANSTPLNSSRQRHNSRHQQQLQMSTSNDEVQKAQDAAKSVDTDPPTIFDKIVSGDIPSDKVYEDDTTLAFRDVNPQAPVHMLVIPKQRQGLSQLSKATESQEAVLGHLMFVAGKLGREHCPKGFRIVINDGVDGAQSVYHLHLHVMGGRQLGWPPG